MALLEHVRDLTRYGYDRSKHNQTHVMQTNGETTLCGVPIFSDLEGHRIQRMYPVNAPIGCAKCVKGIEMALRHNLSFMSAEQLEEILELAYKFRNGDWANLE